MGEATKPFKHFIPLDGHYWSVISGHMYKLGKPSMDELDKKSLFFNMLEKIANVFVGFRWAK